MTDPPTYISFLIRLGRQQPRERLGAATNWQGEFEHIQSGQRWPFQGLDASFDLIWRQLPDSRGRE